MTAAMEIFERTKAFPEEERYAMVDQMRRSSRSVCANVAEAWRRRRSEQYFKSNTKSDGRWRLVCRKKRRVAPFRADCSLRDPDITSRILYKIGDAESEAEETRVWIEFAYRCEYLDAERAGSLDETYDRLIGQLVHMRANADDWVLRT